MLYKYCYYSHFEVQRESVPAEARGYIKDPLPNISMIINPLLVYSSDGEPFRACNDNEEQAVTSTPQVHHYCSRDPLQALPTMGRQLRFGTVNIIIQISLAGLAKHSIETFIYE